jgi:membrane protein DedA with SNARE-associated domain
VTHLVDHYGLLFLFGIVALESAGAWVPGETALVTAGVLAAQGHLSIELVVLVAALAAILGDNIGYWIGRAGGRRLAERLPWLARFLPPAERFFTRHGGKAVFFARFLAGLRVTGAWMAGISRMHWWRFFGWNALGGIVWATAVGLIAYFFGRAAGDAISHYGLYGAAVAVVLGAAALVGVHLWRRRAEST